MPLPGQIPYSFYCSRCKFDHPGECASTAARAPRATYVMEPEPGSSRPMYCLSCGGPRGPKNYICGDCCDAVQGWDARLNGLMDQWSAGEREFPHLAGIAPPSAAPPPRGLVLLMGSRWLSETASVPGAAWKSSSPYTFTVVAYDASTDVVSISSSGGPQLYDYPRAHWEPGGARGKAGFHLRFVAAP